MPSPLLSTKLTLPLPVAGTLDRPRLTAALDEAVASGRRLILLSAPAGFGKTTLAAGWLRQRTAEGLKVAWLSLDPQDNDPLDFWRYLIAALQTVDPLIGKNDLASLGAPPAPAAGPPPFELLAASLVNDLALCRGPLVLALDDYHHVTGAEIHAGLNYFIDHLPPGKTLLLLTRVDPPLALSKRRARAQLCETRAAHLRFTLAETVDFLAATGIRLPAGDLAALDQRTEGWVAGLQLAALSLKECHDPHAFILAFAGDDRYVVDYLLEEVLHSLGADVQDFLLRTSILDRLCAGLADEVAGGQGAGNVSQAGYSQDLLERLEASNLFIAPLDNRRRWYRYHPLFADLLRRRLKQSLPGAEVRALYRRACGWYEREGLPAEAIAQALALPDFECAANLMERHILDYFYRSETMKVYHWLKALPESLVKARPLLAAVFAAACTLAPPFPPATVKEGERWLGEAGIALLRFEQEAGPPLEPGAEARMELARCFMGMFSAYLSRFRSEPPELTIDLSLQALEMLPFPGAGVDPNFTRMRSALLTNLGYAYLLQGNEVDCVATMEEARRIGLACGDLFNYAASINCLAMIARHHGDLQQAADLCREMMACIENPAGSAEQPVPYAANAMFLLGALLYEWNRLDEAQALLERALKLAKLSSGSMMTVDGCLTLAQLFLDRGQVEAALAQVDEAERLWTGAAETVQVFRALVSEQAGFEPPEGRVEGRLFAAPVDIYGLERSLALNTARLWITRALKGKPQALGPLEHWLEGQSRALSDIGWRYWTAQFGLLQALCLWASGRKDRALPVFRRALVEGCQIGVIRMFVKEGESARQMLKALRDLPPEEQAYAERLLACFPETPPAPLPFKAAPRMASLDRPRARLSQEDDEMPLVEALSTREVEVLRLLAVGASNAEIAQKLVIAPNTAKKHVIHILGKLGVSNRSKAVSRARELGLI